MPDWLAVETELPLEVTTPVLAVGAETKGVFCLAHGRRAWVSIDHGALTAAESFRAFRRNITQAQDELRTEAELVARDLHPGYVSTGFARAMGSRECVVQHHHAHIAACMAENGFLDPVVGVCCDGAGCGEDKASWGCEVLRVTPTAFRRVAHLKYFGLPGADAAATQCWRPAFSLARQAFGADFPDDVSRAFEGVEEEHRQITDRMLARGVQCPRTSSLGRLFDAVAYLLGVCRTNTHEGQAACELQAAAESATSSAVALDVAFTETASATEIDFGPAIRELFRRSREGADVARLAADFHETIASALARAALEESRCSGVDTVALSGGCFANKLLAGRLAELLRREGFRVLEHKTVSSGDAGVPLGQVLVAAARQVWISPKGVTS